MQAIKALKQTPVRRQIEGGRDVQGLVKSSVLLLRGQPKLP
jgi:hypothetical protein